MDLRQCIARTARPPALLYLDKCFFKSLILRMKGEENEKISYISIIVRS
jgi:hypothetical protein